MAKRIKRTQIVDAISGEVLQEHLETLFSSEAFIPERGYRLYSRNHVRLGKWDKRINIRLWGVVYDVTLTMDETNKVNVDALVDRIGVTKRRVYQLLSKLVEHGAVAKAKGGYYLNPAIAFAGTYLAPWLYHLFKDDLKKAVPLWAQARYEQEEKPDE